MNTQNRPVYIGDNLTTSRKATVDGNFVEILGRQYYRIENYDSMPPFFMTLVSASDHWLFISSTGGLSAGRRNAESALFPYYTDDKLTENSENTGSKTIMFVEKTDKVFLWEPFSERYEGVYETERNLYKSIHGDVLIFEEVNRNLNLRFEYRWQTSHRYGFVKTSKLANLGNTPVHVGVLDGLQNLLPHGASSALQLSFSNLLDAYKRNELHANSGLGMIGLSASLTDLPEPRESLKVTTAWQCGLDPCTHLLSSGQLETYRRTGAITSESDIRGRRGAFFSAAELDLKSGAGREWSTVVDVGQDARDVHDLIHLLIADKHALMSSVKEDIATNTKKITALAGSSDGIQKTGDTLGSTHHFTNVMFNIMRGGVPANGYTLIRDDFIDFIQTRNENVFRECASLLHSLPESFPHSDLRSLTDRQKSVDLTRLCREYLPLIFSRRHGDPSRPWNAFSINLQNEDGSMHFDYQGNWRDIFQNWEALALSFPEYIESMICIFLNSCTADGYNPYRIMREGIDWEKPEPDNPWAGIGYWSDHQIIYLLKLLEMSDKYHPEELDSLLRLEMFSYANVPYEIAPYDSMIEDPYNTITFNAEKDAHISGLVGKMGSDARLVLDSQGQVVHKSFFEKVLVLLLAKLANYVPGGGIWMNTQRPEWNDANNALVGKGVSVVTLSYVRRFIVFLKHLIERNRDDGFPVSREIAAWLTATKEVFINHGTQISKDVSASDRRSMMDELGRIGAAYRSQLYRQGISEDTEEIDADEVLEFLDCALSHVDTSLLANERNDGLFHSYNTLAFGDGTVTLSRLEEMLEGQVAILSSHLLSPENAAKTLDALRRSALYREDQNTYILYPDRDLPGFVTRNVVSRRAVDESALLTALTAHNDTSLLVRDTSGLYHFAGSFQNGKDVRVALDQLRSDDRFQSMVDEEGEAIVSLFEDTFDHKSFTGRSSRFFGFEGLGSVYWHMVSKLLLSAQEAVISAVEGQADASDVRALVDMYYDIRSGLGFNKTPAAFGAFPIDPYSHTPKGSGAKQPGMTGQVKEEVITRITELGLLIQDGLIRFTPILLRSSEFVDGESIFRYVDVKDNQQELVLSQGSFGYTLCQVPVVCSRSRHQRIVITYASGTSDNIEGLVLNPRASRHIFMRDDEVRRLDVYLEPGIG